MSGRVAKLSTKQRFKTSFAENIFRQKYAQGPNDSWDNLAIRLVDDVCGTRNGTEPMALMSKEERSQLVQYIQRMQFIPGGRYLYYAGRSAHFYNNCFLLRAEEDTREEWANIVYRAMSCLCSGGGIGIDYSILRPSGRVLSRTGGIASGPIPLMKAVNEIGRNVMQGGSRRSAIYASLNWQHDDIMDFVHSKIYDDETKARKAQDFNYAAPLDMTNISINWDDAWLDSYKRHRNPIFLESVRRMLIDGEPGHSYNFGENQNETLRNACCEVTSEDDSDVCNLGSVNLANISSIEEFSSVVELAAKFLVCGTIRGELPYDKVYTVRNKNRRIGLGLMGIHEWLLARGEKYEVTPELHKWLEVYREVSVRGANEHCDRFYLNYPVKYRAIAPTGTIGILASTTTGIEPLFAIAYKRRYLVSGTRWKYEYVIDATADRIIKECGVPADRIDTAYSLAETPERRIRFQADVQSYVDHAISSTINLPSYDPERVTDEYVENFAKILSDHAPLLRGITVYPDGSRGSQPLTVVPYEEALASKGVVFDELEEKCAGGSICSF